MLPSAVINFVTGMQQKVRELTKLTYMKGGPPRCISSTIYYISTVNTKHKQRLDVLVQLGYMWLHVSAVKRPSSGQQRIVLLRYGQIDCTILLYLNNTTFCWPEDGRLTAETCRQI